jgi:hypothetical protein
MSLIAHKCLAAPGFAVERKELDKQIQFEVREAKRIQQEQQCSWSEALRLACDGPLDLKAPALCVSDADRRAVDDWRERHPFKGHDYQAKKAAATGN